MFQMNPERVHYLAMNSLQNACNIPIIKHIIQQQFSKQHEVLEKEVFGLRFKNPVGLGAGFDKNATYLHALSCLGFGFVEIGTVTPKAQSGNEKPRLFRLPADKALINRMGFNNDGVLAIQKRLADWKNKAAKISTSALIVGGNIGKNKHTKNEDAWKDFTLCFDALFDVADYFVVNVSSPNTPGLRALQEKDALKKILSSIQNINFGKYKPKPLLLKIAPDLTTWQLDDIIALAEEVQLSGMVISNTTIERSTLKATPAAIVEHIGSGGLSGAPLLLKSNEVLKYVASQTNYRLPIIGSGGIFTADDAKQKILLGASLIQVWTGFVYEGPGITHKICKGLINK
jgi:dihydroorotate dehydrogenase